MDVCSLWITCLIVSITALSASAEIVKGSVNDILNLPCKYTFQGIGYAMCWGHGDCPNSGCSNEVIKTDGKNVILRKSDRYQLLGNIARGDVSLTIIGVTKEDEGIFCCHVEIPGPNNGQKKNLELKIQGDHHPTITGHHLTTTDHHPKTAYHHPTTTEEDMFSMLEECPDNED
ncbi:T-cell immunoglobulin and mucin domain-containing protein 4-like isoform X2 [Phyllobates terribilis]|uniref:T-cell immunoglobulin and mucin domain-containing protein 4-like isoform X2 n=1 Tax=Phyllobates terribilis TaxID=111132 RepID=UPI003CCAAE4E